MRDIVQNHLLQLCALVAIEPPAEWSPRAVRDEKVKALRAIRKIKPGEVERDAVRGQYGAGVTRGAADERARPNLLVANVSPEEDIVIRVEAKQVGQVMRLRSIDLRVLPLCRTRGRGVAGGV